MPVIFQKQAKDYARKEYEQFQSKRRNHLENQAEEAYIKDLEQAAKQLPAKNKGGAHE